KLRIVEVKGIDVEACGGTHLENTFELEIFKIINSTRVQDGVIRINFACGNAAKKESKKEAELIAELCSLLDCGKETIPVRCEELFTKWKKAKKTVKKKKQIDFDLNLVSCEKADLSDEELVKECCLILSTQPEHLINSIKRFRKELNEFGKKEKQN
ncbi:MAG: hypothetical protein ABIA76_06340, partial [Candidatus Diapherotrites archaeon]